MERTGVAGALAWLCLAAAPENSLPGDALETAVRRPPRGLSRRLAGWVGEQRSPSQLNALAGRLNQERDQTKILEFTAQLEALRRLAGRNADTVKLLEAIRDDIGLGRALDNRLDLSRRSVDRSTHGDDLAALLSVAKRCKDPTEFPRWLTQRLSPTGTEQSRRTNTSQPRITLSTIHRVKGREWPHVIVHDAGEGLMPHRLSADTEEERRVFHVAITRASETVAITAGRPASRFCHRNAYPCTARTRPPGPRGKRDRTNPHTATAPNPGCEEQHRTSPHTATAPRPDRPARSVHPR